MKNERLREAREALGITQKEMAKKIGIVTSAYGHIESTEGAAFSSKLMSVLAELGISMDWIITGKGEMFLPKSPEPDETSDLLNEMSHQIRVMREDMDKIENTIKKLMGRK